MYFTLQTFCRMATESGGLSKEEFLLVQEQLLQLKNENYELREEIKKKNAAASQHQNSPKNEALQFASKVRKSLFLL